MMKWVAVIAIRFCPRHQESLQGAADRRQGDPRLLLAFAPRRCRGLLRSSLFQGQETIGQQHQAGRVVKPTPRAALKMIQPQFFLHLLVALLHRPAAFPEPHRLDPTGAHRQIREGILDLAAGPFLDQQPDWLGPRTAAPCLILARPDANPGELRRQLPLGPLAPTHLVTRQAFGQRFQAVADESARKYRLGPSSWGMKSRGRSSRSDPVRSLATRHPEFESSRIYRGLNRSVVVRIVTSGDRGERVLDVGVRPDSASQIAISSIESAGVQYCIHCSRHEG